jgi:hypothetical protein
VKFFFFGKIHNIENFLKYCIFVLEKKIPKIPIFLERKKEKNLSGKKRKKLHGSFIPHEFVGPGTIPLDPTFGSFTLLEPVSLVKVFRLFRSEQFFWYSECGHSK